MKKISNWHLLYFTVIYLAVFYSSCKHDDTPQKVAFSGILSTLQIDHPRLLLNDARLKELKSLSLTDTRLKKYVNDVLAQAEKDLTKAPIQHVLIGPRLLDKSRECLSRVYNLAFAYRWTGDPRCYKGAVENMKTVCAFADWNPSHFLDVAEMTHAVAIGYDWLYNSMDQQTRETIKAGLLKLGLAEGKKAYLSNAWWKTSTFNWNQVCNSGLLIGALAVAESNPVDASYILTNALQGLPYALKSYGPDGVWEEGPGYWDYATNYTAYGLSALQTALDSTFNLTKYDGMPETGFFPVYASGPTGYMLNYADVGDFSKLSAPHACMWLSSVYHENQISDFIENQLNTRTADVFHIIWYQPNTASSLNCDLDRYFDGKVSLFFSRSSWNDQNALFLGAKAGYNQVNHGHLDLGNFEMDALGVRWVRDLGSDDYNLPDYFGMSATSLRWTYYRLNSFSHNVPVLGNKNQNVYATSNFIKHATGVAEPFAIIDFTSAYKDFASSAQRGFKVVDNRKAILVQDEFTLSKSCEVSWGITTDAAIELVNSQQAVLTLKGQKMTLKILSPSDASFTAGSAQQASPQKVNLGVQRLCATTNATSGKVTVAILLFPQWSGTENDFSMDISPLSAW